MADYTESGSEQHPAVAREANRLRQRLSATDEATFTLQQPKSLDDDDIEVVAVTFTVPTSALLEKMVVHKETPRPSRKDPFFADNDDGEDAFQDGGPEAGGNLPA